MSTTIELPSEAVVTAGSTVRTGISTARPLPEGLAGSWSVTAPIFSSRPVVRPRVTSSPSTSANRASTAGTRHLVERLLDERVDRRAGRSSNAQVERRVDRDRRAAGGRRAT